MTRFAIEDLPPHMRAQAEAQIAGAPAPPPSAMPGATSSIAPKPKASKYRNAPTYREEKRFDSKLEARRYDYLSNLWSVGAVLWFTRQVPFELAPGIRYRCDFLVALPEAPFVRVEDCKGILTADATMKLKLMRSVFGIAVDIVKSGPRGSFTVSPFGA